MSGLTSIGKILGLIGGILAMVYGAASLIDQALDEILSLGSVGADAAGGDAIGSIVRIAIGVLTVLICVDRYEIKDELVLGIVLIVLGLIGSGILAIIGGILAVIDNFT